MAGTPLSQPRSHDFGHLSRRWRGVARAWRLDLWAIAEAGGYPILALRRKKPAPPETPRIYFSAGIHGDEPAGTEGLVGWFEEHAAEAGDLDPMIFPCLNPWGLVNNCRFDPDGRDLNRTYHDDTVPQTRAHRAVLAGLRFDLALTLQEDYDARGTYIYEVPAVRPFWAEAALEKAAAHTPIEPRKSVEGRTCRGGVIRRKIDPALIAQIPQHPEAFLLHFHHAARTFTIETPSEFALDDRIAAQKAMITEFVRRCRSGK